MSDTAKKAKFNQRMGRPKFARGGAVKHLANRRYFDAGGAAIPLNQVNTQGVAPGSGGVAGSSPSQSGLANALGIGNGYQAGAATITPGTNAAQLNNAYTGVQNALNNQIGVTNTLTPQAQDAVNNQNAVAAEELAMTQGGGPNPALTQLQQSTGANVANQAALMAGQRGAAANPALIARQAAQQGAATQQEAVGQGATLQAQQQIAAQQNLANLSANQVGQTQGAATNLTNAQQGEQGILQNANTAANNAAVGMQENINNVNAATSAGNQKAGQGALGAITNAAGSLASGLGIKLAKGGEVEDHIKLAEMNAHSLNHKQMMAGGGISANPLLGNQASIAPINPMAPVMSPLAASNTAGPGDGGSMPTDSSPNVDLSKVGSTAGSALAKGINSLQSTPDAGPYGGQNVGPNAIGSRPTMAHGGNVCPGPHLSHVGNYFSTGGKIPSMVSPGEEYLSPKQVKEVVEGKKNPMTAGERIPGKAKVKGDSLKNDTVPRDLEEGGVVIDKETMNKKSPKAARSFVKRAIHMKSPKGA